MSLLTIENDIAILNLDDGKANVVSLAASTAWRAALKDCQDQAKALIITGNAKMFSAGYDLSVMNSGDEEAATTMVRNGFELVYDLYSHPLPTIAACHGHALGLGAFILLACDTRIGAEGDYKIGLPETAGDMPFTPFLVHFLNAELERRFHKSAALQSQMCSPKTAIEAGFLDHLVAHEQVDSMAQQAAQQLMQLPAGHYNINKQLLRETALRKMRAALDT